MLSSGLDEDFLRAVTASMAGLHRGYYRSVPKHARTAIVAPDLIASVMGEGYGVVEQALGELDRGKIVTEPRSGFQDEMEPRMIAAVEQLSGRKVELFVSKSRVEPRVEIELFMLRPEANAIVSRPPAGLDSPANDIAAGERERLVVAARTLLTAVGDNGLTAGGVAARARVSPEALYAHFADLQSCLDAAREQSEPLR